MLTDRFSLALTEAERLHRNQLRKGTSIPYISHLLAVTAQVLEHGGDEDQAIAALLHDSIEDCADHVGGAQLLRDRFRELFGPHALELIEACTDAETLPKPPWRERKEAHLRHLQTAHPAVLLVVAADKLHNTRTLLADVRRDGPSTWTRFNGGRDGTLWYLSAMCVLLAARLENPITDELRVAVTALHALPA